MDGSLSHLFLVVRIFITLWYVVARVIDIAVLVRMFSVRGRMVLVGRMAYEGFAPESGANFLPSPSLYCPSEFALYRCSFSSWSSVMVAVLPFANFLLAMGLPCWYRGVEHGVE